MLIALLVQNDMVRLAHRSEEEISELLVGRPEVNAFFLSTDIPTPTHDMEKSTQDHGPHLLYDCWCGGS